jgi:hypothetical protein
MTDVSRILTPAKAYHRLYLLFGFGYLKVERLIKDHNKILGQELVNDSK